MKAQHTGSAGSRLQVQINFQRSALQYMLCHNIASGIPALFKVGGIIGFFLFLFFFTNYWLFLSVNLFETSLYEEKKEKFSLL